MARPQAARLAAASGWDVLYCEFSQEDLVTAIAAHQRAEARATLHREERVRRALGEADRD
ncbi:hypothetical protein BH787_gp26 [Gordonia phage GMA4]|uniref:hypothetical protein n=1 Tax=Gordonia phage GMA4 TaxID=1647471 RepID=UPI0006BD4A1D|nr:hypothetical protein BH787_gp26 [Gordonia phage GMA4]AKJ72322.1 hypothetical protein GMA4_47 [Gordonia phage GMA4]